MNPENPVITDDQISSYAAEILRAEIAAINISLDQIDVSFARIVKKILTCSGRIIVSGIGKSGLIGQKISATFASTGSPSHFLHAAEAMHGDLGRISRQDITLLLSYSGETDEVIDLALLLRNDNVPVISMTCSTETRLARLSDGVICIGKQTEACPHDLAPTSSTAAMLALGDALALTVSRAKAFSAADFHRTHPRGTLGKLLQPVADIIRFRVGENAVAVPAHINIEQMLIQSETTPRRCGAVLVVDENSALIGIITDADLRRHLLKLDAELLAQPIANLMTRNPVSISQSAQVRDAVQIIREKRLDELPVVNENNQPIGVLDVQDLVSMKITND